MNLNEAAVKALEEGHKNIKGFYKSLRLKGFGREMFLDAKLELLGIVKDLGGGYFRRVMVGPVAPYHLTAKAKQWGCK